VEASADFHTICVVVGAPSLRYRARAMLQTLPLGNMRVVVAWAELARLFGTWDGST